MVPGNMMLNWLELVIFILSFCAMIVFALTFREFLVGRDFSLPFTSARIVLLAYVLAVVLVFATPTYLQLYQTPQRALWFPMAYRSLLGLSLAGLITLIFRRRITLHQRWIGLLIALVVAGLIYLSVKEGNETMMGMRPALWK